MSAELKAAAPPSLRALIRRWSSWLGRFGGVAKRERLDAEAVAVCARDIGTSASELRLLAGKWPDTSGDLLARRLRALNLDPAKLSAHQSAVVRDLSRLCALCGDKSRCRDDLDRRPGSAAWQSYCLNTSTLTALQREQHERTRNN